VTRSGGRIVVDQLERHGVEIAFGVPGESYLAILDALYDSRIRFVTTRHEVGAANMADAVGKLTGRPGVCMVTRGPGATHAACGVHTAQQDSTPLVLLVGQVPRADLGREAFQEVDHRRLFAPLAKWVEEAVAAAELPELVAEAFQVAASGRPGPVVLSLPEDVLAERAEVSDAEPLEPERADPDADELARLHELLARAVRPLVIVGGAPWSAQAHDDLAAWCEANALPVAAAWRCQDYVDNGSPSYAGHLGLGPDPRLAARVREADLIVAVGARLGDIETGGYSYLEIPRPHQLLVHVHPDPAELGSVYQPDLPIAASPVRFAAAVRRLEPLAGTAWRLETEQARAAYLENLRHQPRGGVGVDMGQAMVFLRERLPAEAILTNGAGNFSVWAHRFYEFRRYRTQLAPTSGAMGYGVPAAVAAKLVHPERIVVALAGDGDFLMTGQELATAAQADAQIVVLVIDNGMLGTIRMHQERHYPGRVSGTVLRSPDFAALANAYGAYGERVEDTAGFEGAFERALAAGAPALLHVLVDPEAITPRQTIGEIRAAAQASAS
jgi:acetolactate synthase I/II/III large subunit